MTGGWAATEGGSTGSAVSASFALCSGSCEREREAEPRSVCGREAHLCFAFFLLCAPFALLFESGGGRGLTGLRGTWACFVGAEEVAYVFGLGDIVFFVGERH